MRAAGFVGVYVLDRRWGIAQGFDTYFDDFDLAKAKGAALATVGAVQPRRSYERGGDADAQRRAWKDAIASNRRFAEGQVFLAKLYLDRRDFPRAETLAGDGLYLAPSGEWARLGGFVSRARARRAARGPSEGLVSAVRKAN